MNAPRARLAISRPRHGGFTLIELLVVVTVIGILAAILVPAIAGVLKTSEELAINTDVQQLDAALQDFKTEFGFYPSDFSEFTDGTGNALDFNDTLVDPRFAASGLTVEGRLLQMLANISSTHREHLDNDLVHTSETRLEHWWEEVGKKLAVDSTNQELRGPRVALWFWLSQLHNDAQYPITGARDPIDPLRFVSKQRVFFDFPGKQLNSIDATTFASRDGSGEYPILEFLQEKNGRVAVMYFHHSSYPAVTINPNPGAPNPSNVAMACAVPGQPNVYFNPDSYQIIVAGHDELFGNFLDSNTIHDYRDNICNFAEGRLDVFLDLP